MTQLKKFLLAGVASVSLAAVPVVSVHAADVLGTATGAVSGVTSGVAGDDVSVDTRMDAAGAAAGEPTDLRVGAKGGVSASGVVDEPSEAEIQGSIDAAARDSADAARNMTGNTINGVTGAASGITGTATGTAKGALRSNTDANANANTGVNARGNVVNDMSAQATTQTAPLENPIPDLDPALQLVDQGYSNIEPLDGAANAEGQTAFSAINPAGAEVNIVVDTRTGAVVSEQPAQ
jgi:hypothetical protein